MTAAAPTRSRRPARAGVLLVTAGLVAAGLAVRHRARPTPAPPPDPVRHLTDYLDQFTDPAALAELADHWDAVGRSADEAVSAATEAGDLDTLLKLADLGGRLRVALFALREHDPARFPDHHLAALDGRNRRAWAAVQQLAPDRPAGYRGLARAALLAGDPEEAAGQLVAGLAACGDRPELRDLLPVAVAGLGDEARRGLADSVLHPAGEARTDPVKWCVAAEVATALDEPDVALAACGRAREVAPDHPWACAAEARLGGAPDARPPAGRTESEVAAAVALRLRQGDVAGAKWAALPLLAAEPTLTAAELEVLGAVLTAANRPADAVRVLERAAGFPRPSAGCLAALAAAYHRNGQPEQARFAALRAEAAAARAP